MNSIKAIGTGIVLAALVGCGGSKPEVLSPQEQEFRRQITFMPERGMPRSTVETFLGQPEHRGRTKSGLEYRMYAIDPGEGLAMKDLDTDQLYTKDFAIRRSIVFDRDGRVLEWYGFERELALAPAPPPPAEEQEGDSE